MPSVDEESCLSKSLATLLLMAYRGNCSVTVIRERIQEMCDAAKSSSRLDEASIAKHVEHFASMLFEEIVGYPFTARAEASEDFSLYRSCNRMARIRLVRKLPLNCMEIKSIIEVYERWPKERAPEEFTVAVEVAISAAQMALSQKKSDNSTNFRFVDAIAPLLNCAKGGLIPLATLGDLIRTGKFPALCSLYYDLSPPRDDAQGQLLVVGPRPDWLPWLRGLDEVLGKFLALSVERNLRGCHLSCIWARPFSCVWLSRVSSVSKVPAVIIAGHRKVVPDLLSDANLGRIPQSVRRRLFDGLSKLGQTEGEAALADSSSPVRPASEACSSSNNGNNILTIPQGIVLVEVLGSHDFTWVRLDSVSPMLLTDLPETMDEETEAGLRDAVGIFAWFREQLVDVEPASADSDVGNFVDILPPSIELLDSIVSPDVDSRSTSSSPSPTPDTAIATATASSEMSTRFNSSITRAKPEAMGKSRKERAIAKVRAMLQVVDNARAQTMSGKGKGSTKPKRASQDDLELELITSQTSDLTTGRNLGSPTAADAQQSGQSVSASESAASRPVKKKGDGDAGAKKRSRDSSHLDGGDEFDEEEEEDGVDEDGVRRVAADRQPYSLLFGGCTQHKYGDGVVTLREVDLGAVIFSKEHRRAEVRKEILKAELAEVKAAISRLHSIAESRERSSTKSYTALDSKSNGAMVDGSVSATQPQSAVANAAASHRMYLQRLQMQQAANQQQMVQSAALQRKQQSEWQEQQDERHLQIKMNHEFVLKQQQMQQEQQQQQQQQQLQQQQHYQFQQQPVYMQQPSMQFSHPLESQQQFQQPQPLPSTESNAAELLAVSLPQSVESSLPSDHHSHVDEQL